MIATLELNGMPSKTVQAEVLEVRGGIVYLRSLSGYATPYSLQSGKRLGFAWDFWRLSAKSRAEIRRTQTEAEER
jgi:hypothetical protein